MATSGVRALWRLSTFVVGSWLVVARGWRSVTSPRPVRWVAAGPHVRRWAAFGCRRLGVRVTAVGPTPPPGSLVVANHLGYIDILTVGGLVPAVFAARHDMQSWPVMGRLAGAGATIFINRQSGREGARGVHAVASALGAGATVLGFPEGTSRGGSEVLPFRTGLFEAAVAARTPVVPAAIRYTALDGEVVTPESLAVIGWFGGESFVHHLLNLAGHREISAEVHFGEPILPPHAGRRELAALAEGRVRELLETPQAL